MNLAKVSSARQITIPMDICKLLNIKPGNKLLFREIPSGEVVISNASDQALKDAQVAFRGAAEELGVKNEDDVMALIREIRYGQKNTDSQKAKDENTNRF